MQSRCMCWDVCEGMDGDTSCPKTLVDLVSPQEQVKSRKSTKKEPVGVTVTFRGLSSGVQGILIEDTIVGLIGTHKIRRVLTPGDNADFFFESCFT